MFYVISILIFVLLFWENHLDLPSVHTDLMLSSLNHKIMKTFLMGEHGSSKSSHLHLEGKKYFEVVMKEVPAA